MRKMTKDNNSKSNKNSRKARKSAGRVTKTGKSSKISKASKTAKKQAKARAPRVKGPFVLEFVAQSGYVVAMPPLDKYGQGRGPGDFAPEVLPTLKAAKEFQKKFFDRIAQAILEKDGVKLTPRKVAKMWQFAITPLADSEAANIPLLNGVAPEGGENSGEPSDDACAGCPEYDTCELRKLDQEVVELKETEETDPAAELTEPADDLALSNETTETTEPAFPEQNEE